MSTCYGGHHLSVQALFVGVGVSCVAFIKMTTPGCLLLLQVGRASSWRLLPACLAASMLVQQVCGVSFIVSCQRLLIDHKAQRVETCLGSGLPYAGSRSAANTAGKPLKDTFDKFALYGAVPQVLLVADWSTQ
jgi:hypothetical protein